MDDFEYLSVYYDQFVGADYQKIAEYIHKKIKRLIPDASQGADLGCGSGSLTFLLADKGYKMLGIDRSEGMLMQAMDKKREEDGVVLLRQDLTKLSLGGEIDFMVSTLDCLNYLETESDVLTFLNGCARFLRRDGVLIIDFNTIYKYEKILNGHNFVYETDDAFCVWENEFEDGRMYYDLTYFIQNGKQYNRYEDHQVQKYFEPEFIIGSLEKLGFKILSIEDDYSQTAITDKTERIVLVAQKGVI